MACRDPEIVARAFEISVSLLSRDGADLAVKAFYRHLPLSLLSILSYLGIGVKQQQQIRAGKIITSEIPFSETSGKVGLGLLLKIDRPIEDIYVDYLEGAALNESLTVLAFGMLNDDRNTTAFNQSASEVESFQELGRQFPEKEPSADAIAAVNQLTRKILQKRLLEYRRGGTKAIEPYLKKGGAEIHPGALLDEAASDSILSDQFPDFHRALVAYPDLELDSSFYWIKLKPTASIFACFALGHRMQCSGSGLRLIVSRLFYIGSGLEAAHTNTALLPSGDGVVILSAVRAMGTALTGLIGSSR